MKFFAKRADSRWVAAKYKEKGHNEALLAGLLAEQSGFCAYTERKVDDDHTCAVEHFDPSLKGTDRDGYLNYYAVLQKANQRKRRTEREHETAAFFRSRFFQQPCGFDARIAYVPGEFVYEELVDDDDEAAAFIDYLGLSSEGRARVRRRHVERLKAIFKDAGYTASERLNFFRRYPSELDYITTLEAELDLDLSEHLASAS